MSKIDEIIDAMQAASRPSDYWNNSDIEFPELKASQLVIQHRLLGGQSVRDHTMAVIDSLTIKNPITLLSGLFHDLGKDCVSNNRASSKFPDHPVKSAHIAKIRLIEWGASSYLIDRVVRIILTHMYDIVGNIGERTIRRFISNVGQDNIENWFTVRKADSASYSHDGHYKRRIIDPFYNNIMEYLGKLPQGNSPAQLQSEPSIDISGKERKSNDTFLSTEGV